MKTNTFMRILGLWVLIIQANKSAAQPADIILYNGKIFTADNRKPFVTAIAIRGNKILATGDGAVLKTYGSATTKQMDLEGKTVVPGFNDQHDHAAFQQSPVPLSYVTTDDRDGNWEGWSRAAVLDAIAQLLSGARPGEWIAGMIGNKIIRDTGMRRALDSLAPDNPVALQVWWGHGLVTNQKGLDAVGLSDAEPDPAGGWYVRNGQGKIASVHENAQVSFWHAIAKTYPGSVKKIMEAYGAAQLKGGITSALFFGSSFSYSTILKILKEASIPQRLRIVAWPGTTPESREWPVAESHPTPMSAVSGIKYLLNHFGPMNYPADTLRKIIAEALITKRQLMMHLSGDSAFGAVLHLIRASGTAAQWRALRVRIEHNMIGRPSKEQCRTLRDYGILVMHTPKYNQGSLLRSLLDQKVIVGIAPDGCMSPFRDLAIICSRQTDPAENITMQQAVTAFTKTNAYAEFREKEKGMLVKGMLADLAVLSQDIFTIPADSVAATQAVLTMIDGKIVYPLQQ